MTTLRQQVETKIKHHLTIAEKFYGRTFRMPTIQYYNKGSIAGTAAGFSWTIRLHEGLLNKYGQTFIDRTPVHELGHLIDYVINPHNHLRAGKRDVHGADWRKVMKNIGATDFDRCHSFDISEFKKQTKKYVWVGTCGCTMELGPKRHAKQMAAYRSESPYGYHMRGHSSCKYVPQSVAKQHVPTQVKEAADNAKPAPASQGQSKKEIAVALWSSCKQDPKLFRASASKLGWSANTINTYMYNVKKGLWS